MKFAMDQWATRFAAVALSFICVTCGASPKQRMPTELPDVNLDVHEVENSSDARRLIEWLSVRTMPLISNGTAVREREREPSLLDRPYKVTLDGSANG